MEKIQKAIPVWRRPAGPYVLAGIIPLLLLVPARAFPAQVPEKTQLIASIDGSALYGAYCSVCHGLDGKGSGPMAKFLKARTPDLTRIALRNRGVFPMIRVERIISGGETLPRGHGPGTMPIWGPIFSQVGSDRDFGPVRVGNLAKYLEKIQQK